MSHNDHNKPSLRPLSCELSTLRDANGSAVWKSGGTTVIASCHGPTAPRQPQTIPLVVSNNDNPRPQEHNVLIQVLLPGNTLRHSTEWEVFLTNVLTACVVLENCPPHSVIQIVLQVPSDDGSVLAALVHASVSAMMDASIPLLYLPVAISCCISHKNQLISLDPSGTQEQDADVGLLTVVVVKGSTNNEDSSPRIGAMHSSGIQMSASQVLTCWKMAQEAAKAVQAFWRMALTHKHQRHANTLFTGVENT